MSRSEFFGWDLLYKTVENEFCKESDVIIAITHWFLITKSFRCIGVGEDKTFSPDEEGTELLPDGWNHGDKNYALRYIFDGKLFILLGTETECVLILNLLNVETRSVSNIAFTPTEKVKKLRGPLTTLVPCVQELLDRFRKELLEPVFTGNTKEVTTQTQTQQTPYDMRVPPPRLPDEPFGVPSEIRNPLQSPNARDPLRDVGRGDLDPLGRGGGGMIFNPPPGPFGGPPGIGPFGGPPGIGPFGGNRIPPPPGARFDPFGPPERNIRGNPDPDHIRPPDYDDMYM